MRSKVRITRTEYAINPSKRTVACIMDINMQFKKHPASEYLFCSDMSSKSYPEVEYGAFRVVGVAKCSPGDYFSIEKGKNIAEARAKIKAFKVAARVYAELVDKFRKRTELLEQSVQACQYAEATEVNHLNMLKI